MSRSLNKGPYIDSRLIKKLENRKAGDKSVMKTWARACVISPEMLGVTFGVHNGKEFVPVFITEEMVGHRLGEFSLTRKFIRHGGKIQKELDMTTKQKELESAKIARSAGDSKK